MTYETPYKFCKNLYRICNLIYLILVYLCVEREQTPPTTSKPIFFKPFIFYCHEHQVFSPRRCRRKVCCGK